MGSTISKQGARAEENRPTPGKNVNLLKTGGGVDLFTSLRDDLQQLEQTLSKHSAGDISQLDQAWDPNDCSPNITLKENDCVAEKVEGRGADMVRGKRGYTGGTHIWEITWKRGHRGHHAVVGLASCHAPLQATSQTALLGSNDKSLGWDIVNNVCLFNGCVIAKYPDAVKRGFQAPDVIRVILNMDEGTLRFKSGVDKKDYGSCLSGLRAFSRNGQKLYPAISATKQGAQIRIEYLGSSEPIYDAVATNGPNVFHSEVGANVELSNGRRTARRIRGFNNGVVMSSRPLKHDECFVVKLEEIDDLPTEYTLDIGVTTNSPEKLSFPETMTDCKIGQSWMICGSRLVLNQQEIETFGKLNLNDLTVGSTVGIMMSLDHELHIFLNGRLKAKCDLHLPSTVYAVIDMFGKGCQVSIAGQPLSSNLKQIAGNDLLMIAGKTEVEVITDKVQATIELMKEMDPRRISKVEAALCTNVKEVYATMTMPLQQLFGDRFKNIGGVNAISNYVTFLRDTGVEHEEVLRCYLKCLEVVLSLTNCSLNFATALGETEMFMMFLKEAKKLATRYKSNEDKAKQVIYALVILHNCSKVAANVARLRAVGAGDILSKYCDPVEHESGIAYIALLSLVNITVSTDMESLYVHDNVLTTVVEHIAEAVANTVEHVTHIVIESANVELNVQTIEQVDAICKLSKSTSCRMSMVKKKITEHLTQLMEVGDQTGQELACNAVWELLSEQTANDIVLSSRITDVIVKLIDSGVKEVANAAKRLNVKINQVLRRTRVHQKLPKVTSLSCPCKYKALCHRYVLMLNIPESTWDEKWHQCYCSNCHAVKEDDNYYTRGDPPKEYGIPVGWYRFGIQVVERFVTRFNTWHRAYHGTIADKVAKILDIGELVIPDDKIRGGHKINVRPGHFDEDWRPDGFNVRQIFVSPSIRYAGYPLYATPTKYLDEETGTMYNSQVVLQVLIAPDSYTVGEETIGITHAIDPRFSNQEIEWATEERGSITLYGVLVKLEESVESSAA